MLDELVTNEADVRLRFSDEERPRLRCGYCEREARPRSYGAALTWFHAHDCARLPRIRDEFEATSPSPTDLAGLYEEAA